MDHYFTNRHDLKSQVKTRHIMMDNRSFHFATDHGVFSKKGLDFGSRLLIESVINMPFHRALDLGCGYGPIGIIVKTFYPKGEMVLADINQRALGLAKDNANRNHVDVVICESDGMSRVEGMFDLILTNPPIRAGKAVVYRFFKEAFEHLDVDGQLFVVIQKKQGAPSALAYCQTLFRKVEVVKKKAGYFVFKCLK